MITGETRLVGLIGNPVAAVALAAHAERGVRRARPRLGVRPAAGRAADELEDALRGLVALGFAGANVTAPHKLDVARLVGAAEPSVNTLVVRDGRLQASSTDAAVLDGRSVERPVVLGDGGAATAFAAALPGRTVSSRGAATGRRTCRDADLVVNATSERDEVLVELGPGQTLVDLPYPETATARGRAGAVRGSRRARGAGRPGRGVVRALDRRAARRST